jgi:hypothetical protein
MITYETKLLELRAKSSVCKDSSHEDPLNINFIIAARILELLFLFSDK